MLLCYLDESGNTGLNLSDPDQPIHYIAAVLIAEDRIQEATKLLDTLAAAAPTVSPLLEYHGNEIYSGKGPWDGVAPRQRVGEYAKALSVIGQVDGVVAYASINKPKLALTSHTNPHLIALQYLCEKIQKWLARQNDPLHQQVLLVADQNHEQEQYAVDLIRSMQKIGGPVGDWTPLAIPLDRIVDNVYFAPSERSTGIQLADLVAYMLNRMDRRQHPPTASDEAVIRIWVEHIAPHLGTWRREWP